MTEIVKVRFSKWDGRAHWAFEMERLGIDDHGLWLWAPAGTDLHRGSEATIEAKHGFVKVIADGQWWTGIWNDGPRTEARSIWTYVDVITPAEWDGETVRMVDLDLDVVRRAGYGRHVESRGGRPDDTFLDQRIARVADADVALVDGPHPFVEAMDGHAAYGRAAGLHIQAHAQRVDGVEYLELRFGE